MTARQKSLILLGIAAIAAILYLRRDRVLLGSARSDGPGMIQVVDVSDGSFFGRTRVLRVVTAGRSRDIQDPWLARLSEGQLPDLRVVWESSTQIALRCGEEGTIVLL